MKEEDFNGYSFSDPKMRREMKYLVVRHRDLDPNGCYAFRNKRNLTKFLKSNGEFGREVFAVFEIKDLTKKL